MNPETPPPNLEQALRALRDLQRASWHQQTANDAYLQQKMELTHRVACLQAEIRRLRAAQPAQVRETTNPPTSQQLTPKLPTPRPPSRDPPTSSAGREPTATEVKTLQDKIAELLRKEVSYRGDLDRAWKATEYQKTEVHKLKNERANLIEQNENLKVGIAKARKAAQITHGLDSNMLEGQTKKPVTSEEAARQLLNIHGGNGSLAVGALRLLLRLPAVLANGQAPAHRNPHRNSPRKPPPNSPPNRSPSFSPNPPPTSSPDPPNAPPNPPLQREATSPRCRAPTAPMTQTPPPHPKGIESRVEKRCIDLTDDAGDKDEEPRKRARKQTPDVMATADESVPLQTAIAPDLRKHPANEASIQSVKNSTEAFQNLVRSLRRHQSAKELKHPVE